MNREPRLVAYLVLSSSLFVGACAGSKTKDEGGGGGGQVYVVDGGVERLQLDSSSWEGYTPPVNPDARPLRCDESGQDCTKCINIKSIGQVAHYGGNTDSTDAFTAYLNGTSNARFLIATTKPNITADWLANYDILILQALELDEYQENQKWVFSQSEIDALATWVTEGGNGIIAMTGYGGNPWEVTPTNQLLQFAGIQYGQTDTFVSSSAQKQYCTCMSIPFNNWTAGSFIAKNMVVTGTTKTAGVGIFHGRPITCDDNVGGACEVVATDPTAGIVAVGKKVGNGHVFVFNDEWVTYTSQWTNAGAIKSSASIANSDCDGYRPDDVFNIPQFWQNVIEWTRPSDAACAFKISDPQVIP